ncbi:MAG: hypothetical protein EA397_14370 [Deltaproteobacteria bacterium]|nr:MAG: hypothetical protein EA397_14370 [Deltaproteobacteria bacterium]
MRFRSPLLLATALVACQGSGCTPEDGDVDVLDPYDVEVGPYNATLRRTAYGIPHIEAQDTKSVFFGTGYAFAQDHLCTLADQVIKVRSERAAYFGPGDNNRHIDSDVAWKALRVVSDAERFWFDLDVDIREGLVAYAAGYNRYLDEVGPSGLPRPCRDEPWVRPITHIDLLAYYLSLGQMGSGYYLLDMIATAAPPLDTGARRRAPISLQEFGERLIPRNGSNGLALGGDETETGRGMVVSNSHFESEGERRWYELHQTVPGEVDVYGVALMGVPLVNMGFNEHVAWTHTVSTTPRFLIYALELRPGDPTRYRYNGEWVDMEIEDITIEVLNEAGQTEPYTHRLYRSHYGPMLNAPLIGWTGSLAFSYRDVNAGNINMIPAWWRMNRATSVQELAQAQDNQGIPWVHTVAADRDGQAYYADSAAAPNLSPQAEQAYQDYLSANFIARQFRDESAYVLDGQDPVFEWVDEGTELPGAVPIERSPKLFTDAWIANANENHWLSNADEPLEGYPMVFGAERAARQGRTKIAAKVAANLAKTDYRGSDGLYSLAELEQAILSYPAEHAETLLPQLIERCEGAEPVNVRWGADRVDVDLTEACDVLASWDGSLRTTARGAHLFREWIGSGEFQLGRLGPFVTFDDFSRQGAVFSDEFDPDDPLFTPSTLHEAPGSGADPILVGLAKAVLQLEELEIPLDAELGTIQFREKGGVRTPNPGGKELEGSLMIADWRGGNSTLLERQHTPRGAWINANTELTVDGYPINAGDTWVSAIAFTDDGPEARGVLVYSQSADPDSPHYNDQAAVHGAGELRDIHYTREQIQADPELVETELSYP